MPTSPVDQDDPGRGSDPVHDLLGMHSRGARTVAYGFFAAGCLLTFGSLKSGVGVAAAVVPLALLAVGGAVLLRTHGDPLPRRATVVVAIVPIVQAIAMLPALRVPINQPLQAAVAFGGGTVLCAFLCVRGRVAASWTSQAIVFAVAAAWALRTGGGLDQAVGQLLSSTGLMVSATLFAWLVRPAAATIYRLRAAQTRQLAERAAADAVRTERATQKARLDELARPLLVTFAEDGGLTGGDVEHARLLEARLRDGIRARALDVRQVTRSTWAARARGVDVRLLDDSRSGPTDADEATMAGLHAEIVTHLDRAVDGQITIRLQPPGRTSLATITTITADGVSIHEIAAAGAAEATAGAENGI